MRSIIKYCFVVTLIFSTIVLTFSSCSQMNDNETAMTNTKTTETIEQMFVSLKNGRYCSNNMDFPEFVINDDTLTTRGPMSKSFTISGSENTQWYKYVIVDNYVVCGPYFVFIINEDGDLVFDSGSVGSPYIKEGTIYKYSDKPKK